MSEAGPTIDVVVVGSGAGAVNAAWPLVESGLRVRMLDLGHTDETYTSQIPDRSFGEIRRQDPSQHRYFLGDDFCGVDFGSTGAGAQLTPPRQFVCRDTDRLTPVTSTSFRPIESLARGGLAGAWGAGCPTFADADLRGLPLSRSDLAPHYETVGERIGVSGARDELLPFLGDLSSLQPPLDLDSTGETIFRRYVGRREQLNRRGLYLGRPRLAVLSRERRGRQAQRYHDMDFWSDAGRSVYRPQWTLEGLETFQNFEYCGGQFVERFSEGLGNGVEVVARGSGRGSPIRHRARRLVLAAGTLGTARIVLRSLERYGDRLPLVCNPHTYVAMLNLSMLGRSARDARHSLAQLCVVHAPDGPTGPTTLGHLYSYRSLHLFRLIKDSPLPTRESLRAFRLLLPSLALMILQHPDDPTREKSCSLSSGEGGADRLCVDYRRNDSERHAADRVERAILAGFRSLRCLPLRRIRPGDAASVHYAGTLPMTHEDRELTCDLDGRLRGTDFVHVADGSLFPRLPSRGLTFTMMALADRIGCRVREILRS